MFDGTGGEKRCVAFVHCGHYAGLSVSLPYRDQTPTTTTCPLPAGKSIHESLPRSSSPSVSNPPVFLILPSLLLLPLLDRERG